MRIAPVKLKARTRVVRALDAIDLATQVHVWASSARRIAPGSLGVLGVAGDEIRETFKEKP